MGFEMRKSSKMARCMRVLAGAFVLLVAVVWTGVGGPSLIGLGSTALAADSASDLSSDQIAAIQAAVQTAIANVDPNLTGAAKERAIAQAIEQATINAIATYGPAAISVVTAAAISAGVPAAQVVAAVMTAAIGTSRVAASTVVADVVLGAVSAGASATLVTEAVIATAATLQLSGNAVGKGLGKAAAEISQTNPDAATQIAQTVSNEGTSGMGQSFADSVIANGGSQQLADAGNQNPNATGETGGTGTGNGQQGGKEEQGTGGTVLPPCDNPSCT